MKYFKHEQALVESEQIGNNTRIWAFVHILPGAKVGFDCNICDNVFIENDVIIGNRVTIKCGVQLWDKVRIEDDVFIGPNATFINNNFPRSKQYPKQHSTILVRKGASIGANATILANIVIGKNAMVGAGAVVTKDVPANAIVVGNPARIKGYVSFSGKQAPGFKTSKEKIKKEGITVVSGVKLYEMPVVTDMRGSLSFAEYKRGLPFIVKRFFILFDVPSKEVRGEHAHKKLHQFLICVKGSCSIMVDDGDKRKEILLDTPKKGIHIAPLVWSVQYKYSSDAVLVVLASDFYDPGDYIRDYDRFLEAVHKSRQRNTK